MHIYEYAQGIQRLCRAVLLLLFLFLQSVSASTCWTSSFCSLLQWVFAMDDQSSLVLLPCSWSSLLCSLGGQRRNLDTLIPSPVNKALLWFCVWPASRTGYSHVSGVLLHSCLWHDNLHPHLALSVFCKKGEKTLSIQNGLMLWPLFTIYRRINMDTYKRSYIFKKIGALAMVFRFCSLPRLVWSIRHLS